MEEETKTTESKTKTERTLTAGRYLVGGVALLLLLALVAPFVVYGFPGVIGADASFVVLSGSMEPKINTGDAVIVDGVRPGRVAVGDVITFTRDGTSAPITHRVVEVSGTGADRSFVTKGDNNEEADPQPVPAANVVGRVVLTIPYIGYVIDFANTEPGYVLFIALPIGLLVLNEAYTLVRKPARRARADDSGATAADETDAESATVADEAADAVFQFTRSDLNLTLLALGALTAYAAYVAVLVDTSAVTVSLLVAAAGVLALVAAIRYGAPSPEEALAMADGGVALTRENRIVAGTVPGDGERSELRVESLADLVAMARADDAWIVNDGDRLALVTDGAVFTHTVEEDQVAPAERAESPEPDDESAEERR